MLHTAVQVAGEGVLYQERGEVEGPQHQLCITIIRTIETSPGPAELTFAPHGLRSRLVTGEDPGARGPHGGGLQDLIAEVQDVDPVEELTLAVGLGLYLLQLL